MAALRKTTDEKLRDYYGSLIAMKAREKHIDIPRLASRMDVCTKTVRTKIDKPGTQTLLEMQALCGYLGLGIVIYDRENEQVTVTRKVD